MSRYEPPYEAPDGFKWRKVLSRHPKRPNEGRIEYFLVPWNWPMDKSYEETVAKAEEVKRQREAA